MKVQLVEDDGDMKTVPPVRVLLVDDSIVSLQGLKTVLSQSKRLTVVGTASSETEAMAAIQRSEPDVVVLDVHIRGVSGLNLCRVIYESHPEIAVFIFTAHDNKELLHDAILAGAQGYLLKSASREAIITSLETVSSGQAIVDQHLTPELIAWIREIREHPRCQPKGDWSKDDVQLMALIAEGKTNKEIAQALGVTPGVISARLQKIYRRLHMSRRSEVANYFVQRRLSALRDSQMGDRGETVTSEGPADKRKNYRMESDV